MTPIYEVKTKHTRKVLEDFIKFTYKIKYPRVTQNLFIMGVCIGFFAYFLRGGIGMYIALFLSAVFILFAAFRKKIGVSKLAKADRSYQKQSEIDLIFGESEFRIENLDACQNTRVRYGEISYIYGDDDNFYISINNEDLQIIPKTDFSLGDAAGFYNFITDKTNLPILPMTIPWKVRIQMMMEYRDKKAEEYEKKQQEKKKNKK